MTTNHQLLERASLVAEYRAYVQHYAALAKVNYGSAPGNKPVELTEAARLNCRAVRARLAEQQENADATT